MDGLSVEKSPVCVALVTGASERIGRAIAISLAQEGFDVVVHAKNNWDELCKTRDRVMQSEKRSLAVLADFSNEKEVQSLCKQVSLFAPTLDILVHNASVFPCCDFENTSQRLYDDVMAVNVKAPFFLCQRLLPLLRKSSNPHVICMLDSMVHRPYSHRTAYFLSKGALETLTHLLAVELAPHVRVNAVALGFALVSAQLTSPRLGKVQDWIPLKRTGSRQDIAAAVMFLVKHASYITGQVLTVDGGSSLMPTPSAT